MYGLAAIEQANGWAMAGAGACIVLTGLAVLSFLISMIPHLPGVAEKKRSSPKEPVKTEPPPPATAPETLPDDINAAAAVYISLTEGLGDSFTLVDLHRISKDVSLPHPHLSINRFRDTGILLSDGEGHFSWQSITE